MRPTPSGAASYAGSVASVVSSLTLTDIGVIVGIATAIATCAVNVYFAWRKSQRDRALVAAQLHELSVREAAQSHD